MWICDVESNKVWLLRKALPLLPWLVLFRCIHVLSDYTHKTSQSIKQASLVSVLLPL